MFVVSIESKSKKFRQVQCESIFEVAQLCHGLQVSACIRNDAGQFMVALHNRVHIYSAAHTEFNYPMRYEFNNAMAAVDPSIVW